MKKIKITAGLYENPNFEGRQTLSYHTLIHRDESPVVAILPHYNNDDADSLAELITDAANTFQKEEMLPSELLSLNQKLMERVNNLLKDKQDLINRLEDSNEIILKTYTELEDHAVRNTALKTMTLNERFLIKLK